MAKKLPEDEVNRRLKKFHGDTVTIDYSTFTKMDKKALFIDKDYGLWWSLPLNVLRGIRHPERAAAQKRYTLNDVKRKIFDAHGEQVTIVDETYVNPHTTATFIDVDHGEFQNCPYHVYAGQGHPVRAVEKKKKTCLERYGVEHSMQSEQAQNARKKTWMKKYGVDNPMKSDDIKSKIDRDAVARKAHETMKREGSYGKSKLEDEFYDALCKLHGKSNVKRQVLVRRWPIDFYITSIDVYVQFDGVYWHGLDKPYEQLKENTTERGRHILEAYTKDRQQDEWFKDNNLTLIRITDEQFINWKKENAKVSI